MVLRPFLKIEGLEMDFKEFSNQYQHKFELFMISKIIPNSGTELELSMKYSLEAPGKRLRPLMLLAMLDGLNHPIEDGFKAASAVEMIHTYSLIHDDLPAMDDDDLRRGLPTNHIKFGEATAILAGDALLTLAFSILSEADAKNKSNLQLQLVYELAQASGYLGMVGGQAGDIANEQKKASLSEIESVHQRKTGALFTFAVRAAGIISEKDAETMKALTLFSEKFGLAYQIRDDLLDVVGDETELGKAVGTDDALGKSTYPNTIGLKATHDLLNETLKECVHILDDLGAKNKNYDFSVLKSLLTQLSINS